MRQWTQLKRTTNLSSVAISVILLIVTLALFLVRQNVLADESDLEEKVNQQRQIITQKKSLEGKLLSVKEKLQVLAAHIELSVNQREILADIFDLESENYHITKAVINEERLVEIEGEASDYQNIADFLLQLKQKDKYIDFRVKEISWDADSQSIDYKLKFTLKQ